MTLKGDLLVLLVLLVVTVVLIVLVIVRRRLLQRPSGTVDMFARLRPRSPAGGWAAGFARYDSDSLHWFRTFSLSPRARISVPRQAMTLSARRRPVGPESIALAPDTVIVTVSRSERPLELAMSDDTLTGFLAWLESAPPGSGMQEV